MKNRMDQLSIVNQTTIKTVNKCLKLHKIICKIESAIVH